MTDWAYNNFIGGTASGSSLTFRTQDIDTGILSTESYLPDPLIDWLPEACQRGKYLPTWHLVKSYGR